MEWLLLPLSFIAFGALFAYAGWTLLAEYRKHFRADPGAVMSVEVFLQILFHPAATAVFMGALGLFIGFWFCAIGLLILAFPLFIGVAQVINGAAMSLGFGRILPF